MVGRISNMKASPVRDRLCSRKIIHRIQTRIAHRMRSEISSADQNILPEMFFDGDVALDS